MSTDAALDDFQRVRPRLFGIAYRMLGSVSEAEDVVQDAWLRWSATDRSEVREPAAFLATTVTRLAMNHLDSARARRETYVGPWLPEPILTSDDDPLLGAERAEALSLAVLMLLERLTPAERAAYVLREAFVYSHAEIAEVLQVSEANARQLASRARRHIAEERGAVVDADTHRRLLEAMTAATVQGDLAALEAVLSADVIVMSDGGGFVLAARTPSRGPERSAVFLRGVLEKFGAGLVAVPALINGELALIALHDGAVHSITAVDVAPDGVRRVFLILNPHKLSGVRRN